MAQVADLESAAVCHRFVLGQQTHGELAGRPLGVIERSGSMLRVVREQRQSVGSVSQEIGKLVQPFRCIHSRMMSLTGTEMK